jgi:hypothetical protein
LLAVEVEVDATINKIRRRLIRPNKEKERICDVGYANWRAAERMKIRIIHVA